MAYIEQFIVQWSNLTGLIEVLQYIYEGTEFTKQTQKVFYTVILRDILVWEYIDLDLLQ